MESLFAGGHHVWALFVGHLLIEKLLKAYHAKHIEGSCPRIHNLLKIAQDAGLALTVEQRAFLDEMTTFNIRARYPDYKNRLYKTATQQFTRRYMEQIREFREWLLPKLTA
ncbi:MAG TPA: HEPN domain-containing protein [Candidatus Hydrogenedentes bacterium]|nr:HEPN domain-containing protein [Candidatus Hydrogenedentota bacterium]HNT86706.1 HEPN domain-containing protein [Candidatus Hydrogenedentota bacterium]